MFEIAEPAVDQLGAGRGGVGGQVVLLDEHHPRAAAGGVASYGRAVDASADDQQVDLFTHSYIW